MEGEQLSALLDPRDLDGSDERLHAALDAEETDDGRAGVLTQLARLASWRDRFDEAWSLLDEADALADNSGEARARVLLERARVVVQTTGDAEALPLAEAAFEAAIAAGAHFVAGDAAHTCALRGDMEAWTARGLALAESHTAATYWRGTLLINLGDWHWERREPAEALATYEAALAAREQVTRNPQLTEEARVGIARALLALGRPDEAVPLLEQAVAWTDESRYSGPEVAEWRNALAAARAEAGT